MYISSKSKESLSINISQETDIPLHCREIIDRWKRFQANSAAASIENGPKSTENVEEKLVKLLESNARSTTVQRQYTEEEKKIREAILAQYSQVLFSPLLYNCYPLSLKFIYILFTEVVRDVNKNQYLLIQ